MFTPSQMFFRIAYAIAYTSLCVVAYAVAYMVPYAVAYNILSIGVFICLIWQLGLKVFSVLLVLPNHFEFASYVLDFFSTIKDTFFLGDATAGQKLKK